MRGRWSWSAHFKIIFAMELEHVGHSGVCRGRWGLYRRSALNSGSIIASNAFEDSPSIRWTSCLPANRSEGSQLGQRRLKERRRGKESEARVSHVSVPMGKITLITSIVRRGHRANIGPTLWCGARWGVDGTRTGDLLHRCDGHEHQIALRGLGQRHAGLTRARKPSTRNNHSVGPPPNCLDKGLPARTWRLRGLHAKIRGPYQDKSD